MTLVVKPDLDIVEMYRHTRNKVSLSRHSKREINENSMNFNDLCVSETSRGKHVHSANVGLILDTPNSVWCLKDLLLG